MKEKHTQGFENLKQKIPELPCLAHYNSDYPNVITTDGSTTPMLGWDPMPRTTGRKTKTDWFHEPFPIRHGKEICNK